MILASLTDLLNQRVNDIGKSMFKLKVEETYCLKFKQEVRDWSDR